MSSHAIISLRDYQITAAVKKDNREVLAAYLQENLLAAHSPAEALVAVKALQKALDVVADNLVEMHLAGAQAKTENVYGAEVKIKLSPAKWDYSECNDPSLADMEARMKELKAEIATRQKFLQNIGGESVDKATGEVVKITTCKVLYLGREVEVNRAKLLEQGQTVAVTLPE